MIERKVFVTGSKGMVASRFLELHGSDYDLYTPEKNELNLTDKSAVSEYFEGKDIDVIVNFAAYTDVGKAEEEKDLCKKVNQEAVANLVNLAKEKNACIIQISTDMVFPGSEEFPGPYDENQEPVDNPEILSWYGYTKLLGEKEIKKYEGDWAIVRIIYPVRAKFDGKPDYLRKPLMLFDEGKLYPMFDDQYVSISFVDEISHALSVIIDRKMKGVFHVASTDTASPHKIVSLLIEKARGKKNAVKPSSLDEFLKKVDNPARYPKYGGLKTETTQKLLGIKFSSMDEIIEELIKQGI